MLACLWAGIVPEFEKTKQPKPKGLMTLSRKILSVIVNLFKPNRQTSLRTMPAPIVPVFPKRVIVAESVGPVPTLVSTSMGRRSKKPAVIIRTPHRAKFLSRRGEYLSADILKRDGNTVLLERNGMVLSPRTLVSS